MDPSKNEQRYSSAYQQLRTILPTEDIFHTFLVAMEHRPACIATISIQNETGRPFCESPQRPKISRETAESTLTDVLDTLQLTYSIERKDLPTKQVTNVYVANTTQRITDFNSQTDDELKLGAFLGYPTDAVNWYLTKDDGLSNWKEWYLKFEAVNHHNRQPHFVEFFKYVEYIPAPTKRSYRETFALAENRDAIARTLNNVCDTTAFTDIKYTTQRKPVAYGVLYALFRTAFEHNPDRN